VIHNYRPDLPDIPDFPDVPAIPDFPDVPDILDFPDVPDVPEKTLNSNMVSAPRNPEAAPIGGRGAL